MLDGVYWISEVDIHVSDDEWAFSNNFAKEIDQHWAIEKHKNNTLFNGVIFLADPNTFNLASDKMSISVWKTDFKSFLYWRDQGKPSHTVDVFGATALVTTDDNLILVQMSPHTANAGKIYFPAGSLDEGDLAHGHIDIQINMVRELAEETGMTLDSEAFSGEKMMVISDGLIAIIKVIELENTAAKAISEIGRFIADQDLSELSSVFAISDDSELPLEVMPNYAIMASKSILSLLSSN